MPDSVIALVETKGNRKLNEYCTVTFTTQVGLLAPSVESHVFPEGSVPGQVVATVKREELIPGGAILSTKLVTSALLAVQL